MSLNAQIKVGAERTDAYIPTLKGKRVAVVANQSSLVNQTHLIDTLLALKIDVQKVFSPEHGFRGTADAGEQVKSFTDKKTGLPCISLYGDNKKPQKRQLTNVDIILFDLQDVGVRFYTYLSTLHYVMEAAAEANIKVVLLDRPNPNIDRIDGPVLEKNCKSFIGMHPIPVLHGMTLGELAQMINQEGWLNEGVSCALEVVAVENYSRNSIYEPPVKPSPNLPNYQSLRLYPSLCFFEGTIISVGRGTEYPFQIYGHPFLKHHGIYNFTPKPSTGAKSPKLNGQVCFGFNLSSAKIELGAPLNLDYLIESYNLYAIKDQFFTPSFFRLLAGTDTLMRQIRDGLSATEIRESWRADLEAFKQKRKAYLMYL